ncbi:hypothetical protein CRG98_018124 [Punica granatum]|uniref:Uncharacterized protein n=1 Tax=Punica granatum TaxID=22663 RepID=A0A2I0JYP5_PUNGR|nr:hypothetical protein CRG98_018124 [Punica granatum]
MHRQGLCKPNHGVAGSRSTSWVVAFPICTSPLWLRRLQVSTPCGGGSRCKVMTAVASTRVALSRLRGGGSAIVVGDGNNGGPVVRTSRLDRVEDFLSHPKSNLSSGSEKCKSCASKKINFGVVGGEGWLPPTLTVSPSNEVSGAIGGHEKREWVRFKKWWLGRFATTTQMMSPTISSEGVVDSSERSHHSPMLILFCQFVFLFSEI